MGSKVNDARINFKTRSWHHVSLSHVCFGVKEGKKGKLEFLILLIFFIVIHPCLVTALLGLPTKCSPSTLRSKWSNTWGTHFTGNTTANKDHTACIIFCAGKSMFGSNNVQYRCKPHLYYLRQHMRIYCSIISTTMPQRKIPALYIRSAPPKEHHSTITCNLNQKPN